MNICWDNLEKLRYSKKTGKWYKKNTIYIYIDKCIVCGNSYITNANRLANTCSYSCAKKEIKLSKIIRKKMSKSGKNKIFSEEHRKNLSKSKKGKNNPMYGKKRKGKKGKNSYNWKNGITKKNIPLYDTYAPQIKYAEKVRRSPDDQNILEVKCTYCGKWYIPKRTEVSRRIQTLNGNLNGEHRLYCSNECKQQCPIYNKSKYPKGYKKASSREVQPELRQLVFKRDNWTCQKCKSKKNLHCHHIEGIRWIPLESADMDKCITYCKQCHKEVHSKEDCSYKDMQCKKEYYEFIR